MLILSCQILKNYYIMLVSMVESFVLEPSLAMKEALELKGISLETDKLALFAFAEHIGARLDEQPKVRLIMSWESPEVLEEDRIIVPVCPQCPLDQITVTESLGSALLRLKFTQQGDELENGAFWSAITSLAAGAGVAALTHTTEPLVVGGIIFGISACAAVYANRVRDDSALPEGTAEFTPPIIVKQLGELCCQAS